MDSDGKNAFGKILRYQSSARRAFKQAQEALEHHRAILCEECETYPIQELSAEEPKSMLPKGFTPVPWSEREARIKALEEPPGPLSAKKRPLSARLCHPTRPWGKMKLPSGKPDTGACMRPVFSGPSNAPASSL